MKRGVCAALVAAVAICGAGAPAAASGSDVPRTPSGWRVTPAGHLLTVTQGPGLSGPWGVALSPDGRHALVTSSGQAVQDETLEMFDITSRARTDVRVMNGHRGHSVFYGVAFSPDGRRAWASGGGQDVLHAYHITPAGRFVPDGPIPAGHFPAGIAYGHTPRGDRLYVANNLGGKSHPNVTDEDPPGHTVMVIDPA